MNGMNFSLSLCESLYVIIDFQVLWFPEDRVLKHKGVKGRRTNLIFFYGGVQRSLTLRELE
jgi:hypothetical protein